MASTPRKKKQMIDLWKKVSVVQELPVKQLHAHNQLPEEFIEWGGCYNWTNNKVEVWLQCQPHVHGILLHEQYKQYNCCAENPCLVWKFELQKVVEWSPAEQIMFQVNSIIHSVMECMKIHYDNKTMISVNQAAEYNPNFNSRNNPFYKGYPLRIENDMLNTEQ